MWETWRLFFKWVKHMNVFLFWLLSWAEISSGQDFSNTISTVNVGAKEWMKISTAQCEAICSSLLTVKSLDQILLSPYKSTYSDRPPFVITLNWLPRGKVADFLNCTSQSLSCYESQEVWCIPFVLVLTVFNLLLSCFHYYIPISPSWNSHRLCFEQWLWSWACFLL